MDDLLLFRQEIQKTQNWGKSKSYFPTKSKFIIDSQTIKYCGHFDRINIFGGRFGSSLTYDQKYIEIDIFESFKMELNLYCEE